MNGFGLDWQFVIVTLAALWGAWILLRPLLPAHKAKTAPGTFEPSGACARCAKGGAGNACVSRQTKEVLNGQQGPARPFGSQTRQR